MDLALHMRCSLADIAACSNSVCKTHRVDSMHATAQRLLEVGLAKGVKTFAEIARALGASDQSATNWKTRGVPPDMIIRAAELYGADAVWLWVGSKSRGQGYYPVTYPAPTPTEPQGAGEKRQAYLHNADEQRLLDGYRVADDSLRRSMLLLAADSLERFGKRRANHN